MLRAKFINDLNLFVLEVGRGKCVLESSLEIAEVLRGGLKEGNEDRKPIYTYFKKRIAKVYLVRLIVRLSWQQIIR